MRSGSTPDGFAGRYLQRSSATGLDAIARVSATGSTSWRSVGDCSSACSSPGVLGLIGLIVLIVLLVRRHNSKSRIRQQQLTAGGYGAYPTSYGQYGSQPGGFSQPGGYPPPAERTAASPGSADGRDTDE